MFAVGTKMGKVSFRFLRQVSGGDSRRGVDLIYSCCGLNSTGEWWSSYAHLNPPRGGTAHDVYERHLWGIHRQ